MVDRPEPVPGPGQVRLRVERCGICGSDLHARHGCDDWADMAQKLGYDRFARSDQQIVYGHEFSGVVTDHGPKTRRRVAEGTPVVALPLLRGGGGVDTVGLSQHAPGAYAEQLVVEEALMMEVPNGLPLGRCRADRADGGCLARRAPGRSGQGHSGGGDRLRAGGPRRDPDAEGQRRADGRGQRLLGGPAGPGGALRRRHRCGPERGLAVHRSPGHGSPGICPRRVRACRRNHPRRCGGFRAGGTSGVWPRSSARGPSTRSSSNAWGCRA